ncbi:MAG: hypothetical protein V4638_03965 [Bacteroidota bacterium]
MRFLFFIVCCTFLKVVIAQPAESYAVTAMHDTIYLYKDVVIDVHSHPQIVNYRDETNTRLNLNSTDLIRLSVVKVNAVKDKITIEEYSIKNIVTSKNSCAHFVSEVYVNGNFSVFDSPYCQTDDYLVLYIKNDDGDLVSINQSNYHAVIDAHFADWRGIDRIRRKRYNPYKLRVLLVEHYHLLSNEGKP